MMTAVPKPKRKRRTKAEMAAFRVILILLNISAYYRNALRISDYA